MIHCSRVHLKARTEETKSKSVRQPTIAYHVNPPILLHCVLKNKTWCISGMMDQAQAFFTPNMSSVHDHFGYMSRFLAQKVKIHITKEEMVFHFLTSGSWEVPNSRCRTVSDVVEEESDMDMDLDLENQQLFSPMEKEPLPASNGLTVE